MAVNQLAQGDTNTAGADQPQGDSWLTKPPESLSAKVTEEPTVWKHGKHDRAEPSKAVEYVKE
jgi:hypothetical protein